MSSSISTISQFELGLKVQHAINEHRSFLDTCDYSEFHLAILSELADNITSAIHDFTTTKEYQRSVIGVENAL